MTNQNTQNSQTLFIGVSTLCAGVVIGGATFAVSRDAMATLFSGTGGSTVGAAISSIIKRREDENQNNQLLTEITSLIHQSQQKNQEIINNYTGEITIIKQQVNQLESNILTNIRDLITQSQTNILEWNKVGNNGEITIIKEQIIELETKILNQNEQIIHILNNFNTEKTSINTKEKELENQHKQQNYQTNTRIKIDVSNTPIINGEKTIVVQWIEKKSIKCRGYNITTEEKITIQKYEELAIYIADNFHIIKEIYRVVNRNINANIKSKSLGGKPYQINLPENEDDFNICREFCQKLNQNGFLYEMPSFGKKIEENRPRNPDETNINLLPNETNQKFLNSVWLEVYIYKKISDLIKYYVQHNDFHLEYDTNININRFYTNIKDTENKKFIPNGEIDIFFLVNNIPLWIECKTYVTDEQKMEFLEKYKEIGKKLSIPKERAFLIVWDWDDNEVEKYLSWQITVVNRNSFEEKIKRAIKNSERELRIDYEGKFPLDMLSEQYNPVAENRKLILEGLIKLFSQDGHQGYSLYEAKDELVKEISDIESEKIHQFLKVVWSGGCLLNNQDQYSKSFNNIATKLISNNVEELEQKCVDQYVKLVLQREKEFLDNSENLEKFEQLIGAKIDQDKINEIKHKIPLKKA